MLNYFTLPTIQTLDILYTFTSLPNPSLHGSLYKKKRVCNAKIVLILHEMSMKCARRAEDFTILFPTFTIAYLVAYFYYYCV